MVIVTAAAQQAVPKGSKGAVAVAILDTVERLRKAQVQESRR